MGGHSCPFGKNESACSFLLSFVNVGKRVASSNDNYIIFGSNCEETAPAVRKYCQFLCKEIAQIEGKLFEIEGVNVSFKFAELPNDMKMLAMLEGQLSSSAKYMFQKTTALTLMGHFQLIRKAFGIPGNMRTGSKLQMKL